MTKDKSRTSSRVKINPQNYCLRELMNPDTFADIPVVEKIMKPERDKEYGITRNMLNEPRKQYLHSFLGENDNYLHLVMQLNEKDFWNEIRDFVYEHRPKDISNLVKKRFARREKTDVWDTLHEWVYVKQVDTPYVVLSTERRRDLIKKII